MNTNKCLVTLTGHTNWVVSCAISPDSQWIATGSYDKQIRIWHRRFIEHQAFGSSVPMSSGLPPPPISMNSFSQQPPLNLYSSNPIQSGPYPPPTNAPQMMPPPPSQIGGYPNMISPSYIPTQQQIQQQPLPPPQQQQQQQQQPAQPFIPQLPSFLQRPAGTFTQQTSFSQSNLSNTGGFTQAPPSFIQSSGSFSQAPPSFAQAPPSFTQSSNINNNATSFSQSGGFSQAPPSFTQSSNNISFNQNAASVSNNNNNSSFSQAPPMFSQTPNNNSFSQAPPNNNSFSQSSNNLNNNASSFSQGGFTQQQQQPPPPPTTVPPPPPPTTVPPPINPPTTVPPPINPSTPPITTVTTTTTAAAATTTSITITAQSSVDDVCKWLEGLSLGELVQSFTSNAINGSVLLDLKEEDLPAIGVTKFGHKRSLVAAIKKLTGDTTASNPSSTSASPSIGRTNPPPTTTQQPPPEQQNANATGGRFVTAGSEAVIYKGMLGLPPNYTPPGTCRDVVFSMDSIKPKVPLLETIVQECEIATDSVASSPTAHALIETHKLTKDEVMALVLYTYDIGTMGNPDENFYYQLNDMLRRRNVTEMRAIMPYLFYALNALRKLPAFKGTVYRGNNSTGIVKREYTTGRKIFWSGFTSTTVDIKVAQDFAGKEGVVFKLNISSGKVISAFSVIGGENEVLLPPNAGLIVAKELYVENGIQYLDLVEEAGTFRW